MSHRYLATVVSTALAGLVAGISALVLVSQPRPAYACSGSFDFNERVVVAVEGWVEGIAFRPDLVPDLIDPPANLMMTVEVRLRVTRVLKGNPPRRLSYFDWSSVSRSTPRLPDGSLGLAPANACGTLERAGRVGPLAAVDPTGKYALVGLQRGIQGLLSANILLGAAFGEGPDDPQIRQLRQFMTERLRPETLPHSGGRPAADAPVLAAVAIIAGALGTVMVRRTARLVASHGGQVIAIRRLRKVGDEPARPTQRKHQQ
jgi:hypothetical protein